MCFVVGPGVALERAAELAANGFVLGSTIPKSRLAKRRGGMPGRFTKDVSRFVWRPSSRLVPVLVLVPVPRHSTGSMRSTPWVFGPTPEADSGSYTGASRLVVGSL
jgi:hypothetical protein